MKGKGSVENIHSDSGRNAQVSSLGGNFTLSHATLWIMQGSLVEGPRNESGGTSEVFDGSWPHLRHDPHFLC